MPTGLSHASAACSRSCLVSLLVLISIHLAAPPSRAQCSQWTTVSSAAPPFTDAVFGTGLRSIVHDPVRNTVWGLGINDGSTGGGCRMSLFQLVGNAWQLSTGLPLGLCFDQNQFVPPVAMAWDPTSQSVVVATQNPATFGTPITLFDFNGVLWTPRTSLNAPSSGITGFAVDPRRNRLLLISGSNELWEWSAGSWTRGPDVPANVSAPNAVGLAFDTLRGVGTVYISSNASGFEQYADYTPSATPGTGSWSVRVVSPPTQGTSATSLIYDPVSAGVVRVGGYYTPCNYQARVALTAPEGWPTASLTTHELANIPGEQSNGRVVNAACFDPSRGSAGGVLAHGGQVQTCVNGGPPATLFRYQDTLALAVTRPTITQQPTSLNLCTGSPGGLTVGAASSSSLRYQWFKRAPGQLYFSAIPGATALIYPTAGTRSPADNGSYVCKIDDACSSILSQAADIVVSDPPTIGTPQWSATTACPGGAVQITVPGVTGTGITLALQRRNDLGAWIDVLTTTPDEPFFAFSNLSPRDTGEYRVVARNSCNTAVSLTTRLQVGATISGAIVAVGSITPCGSVMLRPNAGLDPSGVSGVGTLAFRWYKDGLAVSDAGSISGSLTSSLSISPLTYADTGVYELRLTDSACPGDDRRSFALSLPEPLTTYVQRDPAGPRPPPRQNHAMAYDAARAVTVLYGGLGRDQFSQPLALSDTWEFNGTTWTQKSPATSPGLRYAHAMVYDSVRQRVLLYGGSEPLCSTGCAAPPKSQVWEWDGSNWSLLWTFNALGGPADARAPYPALAFDPAAQRLVLYTGSNPSTDAYQGQTWEFDPAAASWQQRSSSGPTTSSGNPAMYFDASRNKRVLYCLGAFSTNPFTQFPAFYEWNATLGSWGITASDLSGAWQTNQQVFPASFQATNTWVYNTLTRKGESGLMTVTPAGGGGFVSGTYTYAGPPDDPVRVSFQNGFGLANSAQVWDIARRCMVIFGGQNTFPGATNQGQPTNTLVERHFADAPRILDQPVGTTACNVSTGTPSLRVVAVGASVLGFQWQRQSSTGMWTNLTDIPGTLQGTGSSKLLLLAPLGLGGSYRCIVTSSACGSVTSAPAVVSACQADFNCSGAVTVQDIFDFLTAWFASDPRADVNASGSITVQDVFDFLSAWFAGC